MTAVKISRVINPETINRKMKRASTLPAVVEARSGHNGKLSNITCLTRSSLSRCSLSRNPPRSGFVEPEKNEQQTTEEQDGESCSQPQNVADNRAIFAGGGIVVIAVEQHLIDGVADLALRGFDQTHAQVFRRIIHAVEIARDAALRSEHHDGGGVRVLVDLGIVLILEADGLGQCVDRLRGSGEEMPAGRSAGTAVALE